MKTSLLGVVLASLLLPGCFGAQYRTGYNISAHEQVQQRFAFEYECSETLVVTEVSRNQSGYLTTLGVEGCGRRDVFVTDGVGWVRDSGDE